MMKDKTISASSAAMAFQPLFAVKVEDGFWSPRYDLWRTTTIPDVLEKLETRSHVAENLELAARGATSGHQGNYFYDGQLYEALRGASDYLAAKPDATLETAIDRWSLDSEICPVITHPHPNCSIPRCYITLLDVTVGIGTTLIVLILVDEEFPFNLKTAHDALNSWWTW